MGEININRGLISIIALISLCSVACFAFSSEKITIRRADQPRKVDIWTYRDRLAEQYKLEEALRHYRTRQWLWALPAACVAYRRPYYRCGGDYYRAYTYRPYSDSTGEVYIQVPPEMLQHQPGRLGR